MFNMVPFGKKNDMARREDFFDEMMNRFFDNDFFSPAVFNTSSFKVDMKENENEYMLEADLPGIKKDAISIEYENNYLTISAKRDDTVEDKSDNYVRRERHYGEFKRSFYVDNVDESKIDASFNDGVLRVELPKSHKEPKKTNRIQIH